MIPMKRYLFVFLLLMGLAQTAEAGNIILRAVVVNPSETEKQKVPMELPLPREAGKKDVIELTEGLNIVYDAEQGLYKAVGQITLRPGEEKKVQVSMKDIWQIPKKDLQFQKGYLPSLLTVLNTSRYAETAKQIGDTIQSHLDHILASQEEAVNPSKHIEIHRENLALLDEVKNNVRFLEKLSAEKIPMDKSLIESEEDGGKGLPADSIKVITLKMLIKNPSATEKAMMPVDYYLPREVKKKDVINAGDLEVRNDPDRGSVYLHKDEVALAPDETKIYEIVLKDIWRVEPEKIQQLEIKADGFAQGLEGTQFQESAVKLQKEIDELANQIAQNATKSEGQSVENKIEVFMENLSLLSKIKEHVNLLARMEVVDIAAPETTLESLGLESPAEEKSGPTKVADKSKSISDKKGLKLLAGTIFESEALDRTAVWRLIFVVIGFLGFVSLFFYILWWVQIRADRTAAHEFVTSLKAKPENASKE